MSPDENQYAFVMATPLPGATRLGVKIDSQRITSIDFLACTAALSSVQGIVVRRIEQQLKDYFETPGLIIDLPVNPAGSHFQQRVWQAMLQIPLGSTISYGVLAEQLASSARAVAGACRANPIPVVIPCHRVVGKSGLGGYMGATEGDSLDIKVWLLEHESAI